MANTFDTFFSEENLSEVWRYMQEYAGQAGREATRVVLELFFVMKSPETSIIDKGIIIAAFAYQLLPEDLIPRDKYGLLSLLDNGITIGFAYSRMKADVTPEIRAQVDAILDSWFGETTRGGAYIVRDIPQQVGVRQPVKSHPENNIPLANKNTSQRQYEDDEDVIVD